MKYKPTWFSLFIGDRYLNIKWYFETRSTSCPATLSSCLAGLALSRWTHQSARWPLAIEQRRSPLVTGGANELSLGVSNLKIWKDSFYLLHINIIQLKIQLKSSPDRANGWSVVREPGTRMGDNLNYRMNLKIALNLSVHIKFSI